MPEGDTQLSEITVPSVAGLFVEDGGAGILGSRCTACGTPYFPRAASCHNPACPGSQMEECSFGGRGRLWSYSVANFAPPAPYKHDKPFAPYVIGIVDLEAGLRVVGQMVNPVEEVSVGAAVELVVEALYHEDGKAYTTWKFRLV